MARARNIKPGFFTNEELVELPFSTRLLFIGLWTVADRAGRMEDRPKKIKMAIFPADDVDVDDGLNQLEKAGFLVRYEVDGARYIQILAFDKHQHPHKDEKQSEIPAPGLHGASTVQEPVKNSVNPADSLIPDSLIPDTPIKPPAPAAPAGEYPAEFIEAWDCYPKRPGASKKDAFKAWRARVSQGVSPRVITEGVKRYAAYVVAAKTETNFIKLPATFFGPGDHFKADWTLPNPPRASPTARNDRSGAAAAVFGANTLPAVREVIDAN